MMLKALACMLALMCAVSVEAAQKVIFDTDFVAPPQDDGMALILALKSPELQILGVTTVMGNDTVERATADALRVLEIAGRAAKYHAPMFSGSS